MEAFFVHPGSQGLSAMNPQSGLSSRCPLTTAISCSQCACVMKELSFAKPKEF
jgi:hypothetical protein